MVKRIVKILLVVLAAILAAAVIYLAYVMLSYSRISDNQSLVPYNTAGKESVKTDTEYTITTQNMGFGAYLPDFSFFMDGGTESWAKSKESVTGAINEGGKTVLGYKPDFALFQEVDTDSTRSHHVDQQKLLDKIYSEYSGVYAVNYHSAFLMYPLTKPHGASNSGILTYSKYGIESSVRRSLPISTGFSKFLDLDRCYSVSRIKTESGKDLVIYNVHTSAYGGSEEIRKSQMTMLFNDIKSEYEKGNYCICGGDFNHDFTGTSAKELNGDDAPIYGWSQPFPVQYLPDCIKQCTNYRDGLNPTCRDTGDVYKKDSYSVVLDGFLVTDNIECTYVQNMDVSFAYSDHAPVVMKFKLKKQ